MKASGPGQWLSVAVVIDIVLALLLVPLPARADEPLRASLDYTILSEPYRNSVPLNISWNTKIAVDRDPSSPYYGTIYVIGEGARDWNATVTLRRSTDGGRSFSDPIVFDLCNGYNNASCGDFSRGRADIAVGNHGVAFIAGAGLVLRSLDQGLSWQTVAFFENFGTSASIATDHLTNAVYVATVNSSATLLVTSSRDEGLTWGSPVAVSSGATVAVPQIAAFADSVVVGFLSGNSSGVSVKVAASPDGGLAWPIINTVSPPTLCDTASPSVSASPDGIFAVSWYAPTDGTGCHPGGDALATYVSISRDQGSSFSAPVEVSRYYGGETSTGFGDALVFDDRSRLFVAWHGLNETWLPSVYVAYTANLGANFTNASFSANPQGYGGNASTFEKLAAGTNGSVYLVWLDIRSIYEGGGVYFRSVAGEASGEVFSGTQVAANAAVGVELVDPATGTVQARATWTGSPLVLAELPPNVYDVWIHVGNASARAGAMPVRTWNSTGFTVHVEGGPTGPGAHPFPWTTAAAVGGLVLFAAAALVALQHTRLAREEVLQRKVRLLIYEAVREHPGTTFTEVRDAIGLQNGVAAYHLGVLEKQGLLHTEKGRRHRWYYPNGDVSLWRDLPLSPLQRALLEKVGQAPGIGIRELARSLNRHHGSVAYNVKGLAREGLLRTQRTGRKVECFPTDESGTA